MWNLPITIKIDEEEHRIRNKCDYRVILDVISALNDEELTNDKKIQCALFIFYEDLSKITNFQVAIEEMLKIINYGDENDEREKNMPKIMDWERDFKYLVAPINRVLGYEIRSVEYLHWYTFLSGYFEIGECQFSNIITIRTKKAKGQKLEKWEQEFYRENRKMVDLEADLTDDEKEFLAD